MMRTDMTGPTLTRRYPLRAFAAGARWLANPVSEAGAKQVPRIHLYANGPEMLAEVERMRTHPTGKRILADRPDLAATLSNPSSLATLPPGTTGFTDTGLSELTTYSYRILASSTQSGDSDWSNVAQDTTPATPSSSIIFTEDFESPVGDALSIPAGATTFDNPVTTAVTPNISGWAGRMQQTEAGLIPFSGNQFYEMNGGWAIDSSILFEVAAANTLTNGSTLTVSLYSAGAFSDTVDETFDVILSGGAVGTQSGVSDGVQDVWQEHTFNFTVTDPTQAINLKILATRNSTLEEDLLIDRITVDGALVPEPGSIALLGLGFMGCILRRRR